MISSKETLLLMIEDNPDMAELIRAFLMMVRGFKFKLTVADCLADGLQHLAKEEQSFDAVLLDLNLPDSTGFETFDRLYKAAPWVPVVLMTALEDEEMALKAVRNGAQDYLVKNELDGNLLARALMYAVERKRVEEALRESEERYMMAIQGANDGLWDWNLITHKVYFSPRWKDMLGYSNGDIGDQPREWLSRVHPEDAEKVHLALTAHVQGSNAHFESEHRMLCKNGSYIWVLTRGLAVRDEKGKATRMAGSQTDITLRKRTEEQLLHDAFHDALTGLPNRALFIDRLGRSIERSKRHSSRHFAVLFLDLDRFKVINDSLGHTFGDRMLIAVAERLASCLRPSDSIARLGGDEFVILLDEISQVADAVFIAERIQRALQSPLEIDSQKLVTSASIGIVLSDPRYKKAEDILRDADIAMYHAKMLGKATHAVFSQTMRKRAIIRMELESDLRGVLNDEERLAKELGVVYQPIVSMGDGHITGFEALLRWSHPERGPIKPVEFIPVAEETGLIHPLGLWVLRQACHQLAAWQSQLEDDPDFSPLSMNVNISGKQFCRPDLVDNIQAIIQETGIEPSSLSLEITESWLMESEEMFHDILKKIRSLGVNLEVDDFGRGYSSFGYLQSLPVNAIKIDMLFIRRLGTDESNSEIVRSIINLAKSLGMSVIAEGVETKAQLEKLGELGCPFIQGYYISEPVCMKEAGDQLMSNWHQGK